MSAERERLLELMRWAAVTTGDEVADALWDARRAILTRGERRQVQGEVLAALRCELDQLKAMQRDFDDALFTKCGEGEPDLLDPLLVALDFDVPRDGAS